ncbi:SPRY domain-containing SOCS box protein 3-like isoform X2 [Brevipalpus obovatus]
MRTELQNYVPDQWCWSSKFKSDDVTVLDHKKKKAIFYPRWSDGTAAIRGDRPLNRGRPAKYYWEVHFPERLFGTSVMIGVATKYCRLRADSYTNLIGEDEQGWALSHRGMIWNSGFGKQFCKPFEENVKTTVGLLYDSRRGTLTYYKDGVELGVAFSGLETVKEELYPVVSSTAARIVAVLGDMSKFHYYNTLLDCCCDTILSRLNNSGDISCLPLPQSLQQYLVRYRD